ncbi:uncharacterized protein [Hetaerina americana]|uniref:uncharacterized protein n=1 Tax=Hetaerina americana TaxID=62018 RepID=UPI003A7F1BE9
MDRCGVLNCKNTEANTNVTFYNFPQKPELIAKWLKVTRNSELEGNNASLDNVKICSDHFDCLQFADIEKRKLKLGAVPTIFNPHLDTAGNYVESSLERELINPLRLTLRELRAGVYSNLYKQIEFTCDFHDELSSQKREIRTLLWNLKNSNCQIQLSHKNSKLIKELQSKQLAVYKFLLKCRHQYKSIKGISSICLSKKSRKLDQDMSHSAALLFAEQFSEDGQEEAAHLWTMDEKIRALAINKETPKLYIILEKILVLPPRSELRNLLNSIDITTGMENILFEGLRKMAEKMKKPKDKLCVLLMDEFPLKEGIRHQLGADKIIGFEDSGIHGQSKMPANYALVFMVRGLLRDWYQPVAYYLCHKEMPLVILRRILAEVIESINKLGLTVSAIVCDPGAKNTVLLQSYIAVETYGPFITASGDKVVKFYDPPSLLKNFRDFFMKHYIQYKGKTAKWYHIKILLAREREEDFFLAKKLTPNHLEPTQAMAERMDLVRETLSNTVATAMYIYATTDAPGKIPMPWEVIGTVNVINTIDKLYDSFYRPLKRPRENGKMHSLVTEKTSHPSIWAEALDFMSEWKFYDPNSHKATVVHSVAQDGWINNIESCLTLRDNLLRENIKKFSIRRLNLDPMRKLFSALSHGRKGTTSIQFLSDFKTYLLYESMLKEGEKIEEENTEDTLLVDIRSDCKMEGKGDDLHQLQSKSSDIPELDTLWAWEDPQLAYFEAQSVLWVCAFIARLAVGKVACSKCHAFLVSDSDSPMHFVIEQKATHLMYPSERLCQLMGNLLRFCENAMLNAVYEKRVVAKLTKMSGEHLNVQWFKSCEVHADAMTNYILNLMLRIIVHQYCKKYNKGIKNAK